MKNIRKVLVLLVLALMAAALPVTVSANSAEPPVFIVLCTDAPEDMTVSLQLQSAPDAQIRTYSSSTMWENYYRFFYHPGMEDTGNIILHVSSSEKTFTCALPENVSRSYNNLITLSYKNESIRLGQPVWRQPLLIALRMALTLLIEGLVFYLFGFRDKRSWLVFLIVNLLTQGWLNAIISSNSFSSDYWVIGYYLIEICVFVIESIAYPALILEQGKGKRVLCALAANLASLLLGGWLLSNLPV